MSEQNKSSSSNTDNLKIAAAFKSVLLSKSVTLSELQRKHDQLNNVIKESLTEQNRLMSEILRIAHELTLELEKAQRTFSYSSPEHHQNRSWPK